MGGFLLGFDIGSSSVKASLVNAENGKVAASATCPDREMKITSVQPGWAEQPPSLWWKYLKESLTVLRSGNSREIREVEAIGISYQMHGLVLVDRNLRVLRPSIIWCDSRAVAIGEKAKNTLGANYCLKNLLNSPGNFTASKLKWVMENEPRIFEKVRYFMLPGDFIAMKLTGEVHTTVPGLSEGILWDFRGNSVAKSLLEHFGISESFIPEVVPTFSEQGRLSSETSRELNLPEGIPVTYRAGDQPNNAFSLNVLNPGEVAATAGTSGVVYGIINRPEPDRQSRVNTFVHVNHSSRSPRYGVLLCINGTGILNSWLKRTTAAPSYEEMNQKALRIPAGAGGLTFFPFGNGAERVLGNKQVNAALLGLNFNIHSREHVYRAAQEGIVFALKYGLEVMKKMGIDIKVVRAGKANMFLSPLFRDVFVNTTDAALELYNTDGSRGAAIGAGIGVGYYKNFREAFRGLKTIRREEPRKDKMEIYAELYTRWVEHLKKHTR